MVAAPAFAADTNSQQDKMKACNAQAGDKKGDDRKAFMKTCLSAKPAEPAKPESKMAMCNKKTAGLQGRGAQQGAERVHEGRLTAAADCETRPGDLLSIRPRLTRPQGFTPSAALFLPAARAVPRSAARHRRRTTSPFR